MFKRGAVYWISYRGRDGKRIQESAKTGSKKRAKLFERDRRIASGERGVRNPPGEKTLSAYLRVLKHKGDRINYRVRVQAHLERFLDWSGGDLRKLNNREVNQFLDAGASRELPRQRKPWSAGTCNFARRVLKAFARWLSESERTDPILLHKVAPRRGALMVSRRPLELSEIEAILATSQPPFAAIFTVLIETGMRISELLTARRSDFDPEARTLRISRERSKTGGHSGERNAPLSDDAIQAIEGWLADVREARPRGDAAKADDLIFDGVRRQDALDELRRACKAAGVRGEGVDLHALRVTTASRLCALGVAMPVVQSMLGHKTPVMTMRYARMGEQGAAKMVAEGGLLERLKRQRLPDFEAQTTDGTQHAKP